MHSISSNGYTVFYLTTWGKLGGFRSSFVWFYLLLVSYSTMNPSLVHISNDFLEINSNIWNYCCAFFGSTHTNIGKKFMAQRISTFLKLLIDITKFLDWKTINTHFWYSFTPSNTKAWECSFTKLLPTLGTF